MLKQSRKKNLSRTKKKPRERELAGLFDGQTIYIVSMKLRSLSLRLGCFSLRKALASI